MSRLRTLAVAALLIGGAEAAHAATPAEVLCASYKSAIAKEANPAKREAMIRSLPRGCEVRAAPAPRKAPEPARPRPRPEPAPAPKPAAPPPQPPPPQFPPPPPPEPSPPSSTRLPNGMTIEEANTAGNKAYAGRKYGDAMKLFRLSADAGDATAEADIGDMYFQGHGVPVDYRQAMSWYRKAAAKGHAGAEEGIGALYARGQGVQTDYAEAMKWFRWSAAKGNADAANWIGYFYDHGQGVAKDPSEAARWYAKARNGGR